MSVCVCVCVELFNKQMETNNRLTKPWTIKKSLNADQQRNIKDKSNLNRSVLSMFRH